MRYVVGIMTSKGVVRNFRRLKIKEDYLPQNPSEVAQICLNCPFPDCIDKHGKMCEHYKSELKRIRKSKNEKQRKKVN